MKVFFLTLGLVLSPSSGHELSDRAKGQMLQQARRLDQGEEFDIADYVGDYSIKLMKCLQDDTVGYDEDGYPQYGVVVYRMCPVNSCNSGCESGYAEFAVGLNSYVNYYMEDQAENMNWDDAMDIENYAQCSQYEVDGGDDGSSYYIGPSCTEDEQDIKLAVFADAYCGTPSQVSFDKISNGWSLPYSEGGLVSTNCLACADGDGNGEMCEALYELAPMRCESEWDISHFYYDAMLEVNKFGQDETGCKKISYLEKTPEAFGEWGTVFLLGLLVIGSVAAAVAYSLWWKEKKLTLEKIEDDEEDEGDLGDLDYQQHDDHNMDPPGGQSDPDPTDPTKDPSNWTTV